MPLPADPYRVINPFKKFLINPIPEGVSRYRGISPGAKLIYGRLYRYAGHNGYAYPSKGELAAEVGMCENQARSYLAELVADHFIRIRKQFHGVDVYEFLDHPALHGEVGEPRMGRVNPQDAGGRFDRVNHQDAGGLNHQDAGGRLDPTSLLSEESHIEEGHKTTPPPLVEKTKTQNHPPADEPPFVETVHYESGHRGKPKTKKESRQRFITPISESAVLQGQAAERDAQPCAPAVSHLSETPPEVVSPHPPAPEGPSKASQINFAARWNELVPERPVDTALFTEKPAAYRDPIFAERFETVCAKFRALIRRGADLKYRNLFRANRETGIPWWKLALDDDLEWLVPKLKNGKDKVDPPKDPNKRELEPWEAYPGRLGKGIRWVDVE